MGVFFSSVVPTRKQHTTKKFLDTHLKYYPLPVFNSQDPFFFMAIWMPFFFIVCDVFPTIISCTFHGGFFSECPIYIIKGYWTYIRLNPKPRNTMLPLPRYTLYTETLQSVKREERGNDTAFIIRGESPIRCTYNIIHQYNIQ